MKDTHLEAQTSVPSTHLQECFELVLPALPHALGEFITHKTSDIIGSH